MKRFSTLLATALIAGSLFLPAGAKPTLPVTVRCTNPGNTSAIVSVKTRAPATSFTVTVGGTGSVVMEKSVRSVQAVAKAQEVRVPVTFTAGSEAGGLVVEVRGDFGHGVQSQIQTFSLVGGGQQSVDVRARTDSGGTASPDIVIVPAKTTTEDR